MFLLISQRLRGNKMGMDFFAAGNLLLGLSYVLQLVEGPPAWSAMSVLNHTLALAAPIAYWLAAMRFFGHTVPLWRPLIGFSLAYILAQCLVQWSVGAVPRYAMLYVVSSVLFFAMVLTVVYGVCTFAKDLYVEMVFFAVFISGICVLNALKFMQIVDGGLEALNMDSRFQTIFYIYMSTLATMLPPSIIWLVLRRLTDELREIAGSDPLTDLLNRRGLTQMLQRHLNRRHAPTAHVLLLDIDHFKRINDTYGHQAGDAVLCHVAQVLRVTARPGDLISRVGGEEFVAICLKTDSADAMRLAERLRADIENQAIKIEGSDDVLRCTVTIGVSPLLGGISQLDDALREADSALYRGKAAGRNRSVLAQASADRAVAPAEQAVAYSS